MRVVAGSARGRRLVAPPGRDTRPTTDRVREAVFNALASMGAVRDARVVDLFAGSGALGIEALSRGAAHATFLDEDARAVRVVQQNLDALGLEDRSTVVRADVLRWLAGDPGAFDLALCDPPYAFDGWAALLDALDAGVAVCESDRPVDPPGGWLVTRQKRYGGTVVTIVRRRQDAQNVRE
jgi:16S rRNA (guanine966-N2)-methyltransferase